MSVVAGSRREVGTARQAAVEALLRSRLLRSRLPRFLLASRPVRWIALAGLGAALFLGYLRMARAVPPNADGASNALQAWDMLHGNPPLHGWTVSDVPFYTTELIQYALVELVVGLRGDVIPVAGAMTYTLLVLLVAALAKGRATGVGGLVRAGVAIAVLLVPQPGRAALTLLSSPNHTGTAVPVLLAWLVVDGTVRGHGGPAPAHPRYRPGLAAAVVAVVLAAAQIGDPLAAFIGALPLVLVSALRLVRDARRTPRWWRTARWWRGVDAQLLAAGLASMLLARAVLAAVRLAGGFGTHSPTVEVSDVADLGRHAWLLVTGLSLVFGCYFPGLPGPAAVALGVVHVAALVLVVVAIVAAARAALLRPADGTGDRVADLVVTGIGINAAAFVVSTLPVDVLSARQVVSILPLGALLAGRVLAPRLPRRTAPVLAAVLLVLAAAFVGRVTVAPVVGPHRPVADWLAQRHLEYGLGAYWSANTITLITGGRVTVVPVAADKPIRAYRWESRRDWYDPARHDARFVVIDLKNPSYGTVEGAVGQFGVPVERGDLGRFVVLSYGRNLLVGLPAFCEPGYAPSMAECPD